MANTKQNKSWQAEEDYIRGLGLQEISNKYNVPMGTVNGWHRRYKWAKKREEYNRQRERTLFEVVLESAQNNTRKTLEACDRVTNYCLERIVTLTESGADSKEMEAWTKILDRVGKIQKTVSPEFSEDMAGQMLDEMKPDLVIIDGNLPDTEQAIREVKLDRSRGLMALIAIYPEGVDPTNVKGVHVCEDEAIQEPYDMEDLVKLADSELQRIAEERMFFEQEVHFQFQTAEEWVEQANDLMSRLVEQAQIDEEKAAALSVAFREAVDNAARHGNKNQESRLIDTIYLLDKQKATVTVEDEGDGFDTELYLTRGIQGNAVAAARERNQAGRVGGLGIMLMLKCLDDLEYNYVGNLIKLTKYR